MADNVQVTCIRKRGDHHDPHERIEGLGGVHGGKAWYLPESDIIAELKKPELTRKWSFYVSLAGRSVWVVVASHNGRDYLKTQPDGYAPNNLLNLPECPR
jgi:hypothetical protein